MKKLQIRYNKLLEAVLNFLWRQWSSIGVSGIAGDYSKSEAVIDPEPLLLFSFSICRNEPRLYDEIMDWLTINGQIINVQRLITLQSKYNFNSGPQISASAGYLSNNKEYRLKWKKLSSLYKESEAQKLFFSTNGKVLPVGVSDPVFLERGLIRNNLNLRGNSMEFPLTGVQSLLLRMRSLFGVNARSELLCLMGSVPEIYPAEAARYIGYEKRSIQSILLELSKSGVIEFRSIGKEKYYRLKYGAMSGILPDSYKWINWAHFFKGLEILLNGIRESLNTTDTLILSSELRRLAKDAEPHFNESSTGLFLSNNSRYPGEKFIDVFITDVDRIIERINEL